MNLLRMVSIRTNSRINHSVWLFRKDSRLCEPMPANKSDVPTHVSYSTSSSIGWSRSTHV